MLARITFLFHQESNQRTDRRLEVLEDLHCQRATILRRRTSLRTRSNGSFDNFVPQEPPEPGIKGV
jgi:hypothetical protein